MKKKLFYALYTAAICLVSCSQEETLEQTSQFPNLISFCTSLPEGKMQTKAADNNVKRYIMQIYKDGGNIDLAPDDENTVSITNATGEFELNGATYNLESGATYTAVFWADYDDVYTSNTETTYSVVYLNWVVLNEGKKMTMAYCGKQDFVYGEGESSMNVTLKRAVAQVNLKQKESYTAENGDKINVSYSGHKVYNALTPGAAGDPSNLDVEIEVVPGVKDADTQLGSFLTFATPTLTDFTFSYNEGENISVPNVPLKANYQINITGNFGEISSATTDYDFTVTTDDAWYGQENVVQDSDTTAPIFSNVSVTAEGLTINYSIPVTDETALATTGEVRLKTSDWQQIGETVYVTFEEGTTTTATMTGSFTVEAPGTYIVDYTVKDKSGNEAYGNSSIEVIE
jgi:hypothetical protein